MQKKKDSSTKKHFEPYAIICDESTRDGFKYSYFYGGCMLKESELEKINNELMTFKESLGFKELKRTKITQSNYDKYIQVIDKFFEYVFAGKIKVRIMFVPNEELSQPLKTEDETYSIFYYIFIKRAFNICYARNDVRLRLIFDDLPVNQTTRDKFKQYLISNLSKLNIKNCNRVKTGKDFIEEVDSTKNCLLQCVDVITGVMDSFLNQKPSDEESKRFGARQKVFKHIYGLICTIHPDFNLYESTKPFSTHKGGWTDPYKHLVFRKSDKKQAPDVPTCTATRARSHSE